MPSSHPTMSDSDHSERLSAWFLDLPPLDMPDEKQDACSRADSPVLGEEDPVIRVSFQPFLSCFELTYAST